MPDHHSTPPWARSQGRVTIIIEPDSLYVAVEAALRAMRDYRHDASPPGVVEHYPNRIDPHLPLPLRRAALAVELSRRCRFKTADGEPTDPPDRLLDVVLAAQSIEAVRAARARFGQGEA